MSSEAPAQPELKLLSTIEFGNLQAEVLVDPIGRRCLRLPIGEKGVIFTISMALMTREMLDIGIRAIAEIKAPEVKEGT